LRLRGAKRREPMFNDTRRAVARHDCAEFFACRLRGAYAFVRRAWMKSVIFGSRRARYVKTAIFIRDGCRLIRITEDAALILRCCAAAAYAYMPLRHVYVYAPARLMLADAMLVAPS